MPLELVGAAPGEAIGVALLEPIGAKLAEAIEDVAPSSYLDTRRPSNGGEEGTQ
jgi:hypothetical protein